MAPQRFAAIVLPAPLFAQDDQSFAPEPEQAAPKDLSQDVTFQNQQMLALARLRWQDGWRILPGGIRIRLISGDGSGPHPSVSDVIKLNYEGRLTDGTMFDSSFARGEPEIFPLNQLIRGWQMAVPQMGVGDTAEIAIPAEFRLWPQGQRPNSWPARRSFSRSNCRVSQR